MPIRCEARLSKNSQESKKFLEKVTSKGKKKPNQSHLLFSKLYENMRDAFVSVSMDGRITEYNREYQTMLGYGPDELLEMTYEQLTPLKWHAYEDEIVRTQIIPRGHSDIYEKEYRRKDGVILPVELRTILIRNKQGQPEGMWAVVRDISQRKQAEQELRNSEEMNRLILNTSTSSVLLIDKDGTILTVNEAAAQRFNKSVTELIGKHAIDLLTPELAEKRKQMMDHVFRSGEMLHYEDQRQGTWFDNRIYPIFDEKGQVIRLVIFANDMTERKQMVEALKASEERYRGLAEASHDSIFILDKEDVFLYINNQAADELGVDVDKIIGHKRSEFSDSDFGLRQNKHILKAIKSGEPFIFDTSIRVHGKNHWFNTRLVPLRNSSGEYYAVLGVARDITDRKRTEQALIRARQQLEARVAKRTTELEMTQAQLRNLANQVVSAQEEERRQVSRELHDDAGQMLISLHYKLAALLDEATGSEHTQGREQLASALELVDSTTEHIRTLAHSLRPPALDVGGIHISVKEFCREFSDLTKIIVEYQGENIPDLPQEISISLYRFVQEALTNVLKHAHADRVRVRLLRRKNEIILSISDNGEGFPESGTSKGIGLLGIEERINLVGGNLKVRSKAGRGVALIARIPWESENPGQSMAEGKW
jgi:PAS domain S-box-containing protein